MQDACKRPSAALILGLTEGDLQGRRKVEQCREQLPRRKNQRAAHALRKRQIRDRALSIRVITWMFVRLCLVSFHITQKERMSNTAPEFSDLSKIEEELLVAKLQATRKAISHAGEKGRALENEVLRLVRDLLPSEYGLSTGFVAYQTPEGPRLSSQLDIIIYDAVRCGPIVKLESCDVFPLEAVYGYIEVKASICSSSDSAKEATDNSIEACLNKNKILREMVDRRYWAPKSNIESGLIKHEWMGLRSYVFAFEPEGSIAKNPEIFAQRIADVSKRLGVPTHLHGIFIANHSYLVTRPVDVHSAKPTDYYHICYTSEHPLFAFKTSLMRALTTFPRFKDGWTPAIDQYYTEEPSWGIKGPKNEN